MNYCCLLIMHGGIMLSVCGDRTHALTSNPVSDSLSGHY